MPSDLDVHLVMDNYGTHKTAIIRNWFAKTTPLSRLYGSRRSLFLPENSHEEMIKVV